MAEQQDYAGLDWVLEEIETTLTSARQALESYQIESGNPAHLSSAQAAFTQVHGALKVLQHEGAIHLSQEMNRLTEALINQRITESRIALETLMQGILQLPAYIQHTINLGVDQPLAILPLINDLRKQRGKDPLPESTFFFPDISSTIDPVAQPQLDVLEKTGVISLLRKIRQKYQLTLAAYLRDQNPSQQIIIFGKIFAKLQDISWGAPISPLWEASLALTEAIGQGDVERSLHTTNLFRELDHQLREFIAQGTSYINTTPEDNLFRGLLYCIAHSTAESEFTTALKERYQLDETLKKATQGTEQNLLGVDATTPVVEAISQELTGIKEALDLYLLSSEPDPLVLENQLPIFQQVTDTLAILGMNDFREKLNQKKKLLISVINSGQNAEEHLMDVAGTILQLESALEQYAKGETVSSDELESPLIREVYQVVINEARHTLDQAKDAIVDFIDSHHQVDYLQQLPELLHKVCGGLSMTPLTRASALLKQCSAHIENEWLNKSVTPEKSDLEHLADTVTSVEYYLERLSDKSHEDHEAILDIAEESLNALQQPLTDVSFDDLEITLDEQSFLEGSVPVEFEEDKSAADRLSIPQVQSRPYDVVDFEFSSSTQSHVQEVPEQPEPVLDSEKGVDSEGIAFEFDTPEKTSVTTGIEVIEDDLIDDELLEVFIEEAGEVQQELATKVPYWLEDQTDDAALKDARRAYHTLKGSGRMVGANVVGELAWSIENMLNRLIDGSIKSTHELRLLIEQVTQMLPALINDFAQQNQLLTAEVLECMERADALAKGERYKVLGDETASEPQDITDELDSATEEQPEIVLEESSESIQEVAEEILEENIYDIQLLSVFLTEARTHLDVLRSFVDHVKDHGGRRQITDQVQRSLHTLKGTALMTEIEPLATLIVGLEKNIKDFRAQLVPADDRVINMLEKGIAFIEDGLEQLTVSPKEPVLDTENYLHWLEALHAQLLSEHFKAQEIERKYTGGQKTELFATEDLGLLLDADLYIENWREALQHEQLTLFRQQLIALAERASEARLPALSELCDVLVGVISYLSTHEDHLPTVLAAPLSNGFEALVDMMNQVAAQQTPVSPQAVFTELRQSLEKLLNGTVSEETVTDPEAELLIELDVDDNVSTDVLEVETQILESLNIESDEETSFAETDIEPINNFALETYTEESLQESAPVLNIEVEEHDVELMELFLEEASDLIEDCHQSLEEWQNNPNNLAPLSDMQRHLHTLKGSARMAEQLEIGDLSHALEDVYTAISSGRQAPDKAPVELIHSAHDHMEAMLAALKKQETPPSALKLTEQLTVWAFDTQTEIALEPLATTDEPIEVLPDYLGHSTEPVKVAETTTQVESDQEIEIQVQAGPAISTEIAINQESPTARIDAPVTQNLAKGNEMIRVPAQLVEQLLNLSGESGINRGRLEQQIQDISNFLGEMDSTIDRVKEQLRRLDTETQAQIISTFESEQAENPEFDPLEMDQYSELTQLSRALVESASDLKDLKESIQDKSRDAETLLLQQSRTQVDLQEKLIQARMVSFSRLLPRLRKITRQLSSELGKPVNLNVTNAEGEMDKTMLERILAPLEHMLRNAIDHGIEDSTKEREEKGKPAAGNLELAIARDGADILLELKDDGRGINLNAIRQKAIEKNLINAKDQLTQQETAELILEPGFTTASSITQISGRGVGLDIVNTEIRQLGGSIHIDTELDKGTSFKLRLPFTLSVNRALMVRVGDNLYALPMQAIDGITTLAPDDLKDCYENGKALEYGGIAHQVMFMGELLELSNPRIQAEQCPIVIVERGGQNLALHVDEIIGSREIFTKSLGQQFAGLTGVNGATILGDGRVVVIIDPTALLRRHRIDQHTVEIEEHAVVETVSARKVLVVDDSVTVRKVTTRLLERQGFDVDNARDGVEAMTKLADNTYDIMLLDIEMPKMDGYEVLTSVRNDNRLKSLPVIMITSRTGEKHKSRAYNLGVNNYLGKPFQESTLLNAIDELVDVSVAADTQGVKHG